MKIIKNVLLIVLFAARSVAQDSIHGMVTLSTEYLYPYGQFNYIQAMCKNVWSDLDLFLTHEPLEQLEEKVPVLCKDIDGLLVAVKRMVAQPAEAASYLPEDMIYLMRLVTLLAHKYRLVCARIEQHSGADLSRYLKRFDEMSTNLEYIKSLRNEIALIEQEDFPVF